MDTGTVHYDSAIGIMIGTLSLMVALIQTVRLNRLRKLRINRLRQDLISCRLAVVESDRLHRRREEYGINDPGAIARVRSIHANACNLTRSLFEQLSEVDRPYDANKLEQYVRLDVITSKWFWRQAALFVENPSKLAMPELPEDTPDYMEGAPGTKNASIEDVGLATGEPNQTPAAGGQGRR
jgi:hypothetical protein